MSLAFLPYRRLCDLTAAAHGVHYAFDEAEGAAVANDAARLAACLAEGLSELRRCAAHLGFGLVPLDDCPAQARIDAARLIAGEDAPEPDPACFFAQHEARDDAAATRADERHDLEASR